MAPSRAALGGVLAVFAAVALAAPISPSYDTPLPPVIKICVLAFPPFVMQRVRACCAAPR